VRINSKLKATVMAVAMAAMPLVAHSAGLGRLNILSGLGQPLRAEIDLVAVQAAEVESLKAALAPAAAFREAQIDYPPVSLGLRFNLDKRANGQYFIAVNSSQAVNEPFLDFLVELKWDGGRVLREYTALLDPVGYNPGSNTAAPVASRPSPAQPATAAATQPATAPASKPVAQAKPEPVKAPEASPAKKPEAKPASGDQTYTVKSGDTLAGVAHLNMVEGVSLDQMLVGLYRANQGAFAGNMNRLKQGQVLTIPNKDTLTSVDRAAAAQEIKVQAEDWRNYRSKVADSAPASSGETKSGSGKITAKVEDKVKTPEPTSKDTLKLSKGDDGKLKERVQSLEEEAAARKKALAESNQRVADLEKTNKKLEDLLALKNKQGAELQKQADAAAKAPAKAAEPPKAEAKPEAKHETKPEVKPAPVAEAKPESKPEAKPETKVEAPAATAPAETKAPEAAAEQPKPKPKKKPPVIMPEPEPEPSLLENPLVLGGGAAVVLLGGGAFFLSRRRKKGNFEDSVITGSDLKSNTMVGNTGGAVISTGVTENSFLTDFSRAGLGTIDTDEVDPIAEAEVYMAYGRDTQAEEILKDALTRDGARQEVRLKLLEIYSGRKNASAFEQTAQELYSGTQGQGPLWTQAAEMGRALDPQNTLYQQQAPVDTGSLDKTMVMAAGTLGELGDTARFDSPLLAPEEQAAAADLDFQLDSAEPAPAAPASDLDFDLGFDTAPEAAHEVPAEIATLADDTPTEAPAAAQEMDFDLGDFNLDLPAADEPKAETPAAQDDGILSLDIPLDLPSEPAPASAAVSPLDLDSDDFKVPDLSLPASDATLAELDTPDLASGLDFNFDDTPAPAAAAEAPLNLDGVSLDLDIAPEAASGADVVDFGAELDDPVTTKIDLARAYIDMGDKEGAREILQEALTEGSPDQKSTAESLLAQL